MKIWLKRLFWLVVLVVVLAVDYFAAENYKTYRKYPMGKA